MTTFDPEVDYMPDEALDKLDELIPLILQDFDIAGEDYSPNMIAVRFDVPNAISRYNPLGRTGLSPVEALCHAAMCADALVKNLREARRQLRERAEDPE